MFNAKYNRILPTLLFILSLGHLAVASQQSNNTLALKSQNRFFSSLTDLKQRDLVVQLGNYWGSQGEAQNIQVRYLFGNHYTVANQNAQNGLFGLGYYINGVDIDPFNLSYGINGFYLAKTGVNGTIIQEDAFTNIAYSYKIQHIPVYLGAKALIKNKKQKYNVTLDAGVGPNFMHAYHYKETPLTDEIFPDNGFSSNHNVTFSAMAGIGLRLNSVFGSAPLECGYRFFYLGQGQLAINNNQLLNTLKTGHTFGNAILCAMTV